MNDAADTIAAIATPPGRGGIGIVRVSGPGAPAIADALAGADPEPRRADYRAFRDAAGEPIDRGILLFFPAPASFTGEDVLELHGHGGRQVMQLLLDRVLSLGARPARPGEFTERAFLNGKLDLLQAEAVADLVDSLSAAAARSAMRSLEGDFSGRIEALVERLTAIRVQVESALDFADEDIAAAGGEAVAGRLWAWRADLDMLLAAARKGRTLRRGLRVALAGRPNVGKSSLLNRLAQSERAIVHDAPGTTRDTIEEDIELGSIAMHLVDTAGIRDAGDGVEAEGVRRTLAAAEQADVIVLVTDRDDADDITAARLPAGPHRIRVRNKIDLSTGATARVTAGADPVIHLSALTGAGMELLEAALVEEAGLGGGEDVLLARTRHIDALLAAAAAVERALECHAESRPPELLAEELRQAQQALGLITGAVSSDDLLGEIFAHFCIGK